MIGLEYYERRIDTTIKVTSVNKNDVEKFILDLCRVGGINELSANVLLCSADLMQE